MESEPATNRWQTVGLVSRAPRSLNLSLQPFTLSDIRFLGEQALGPQSSADLATFLFDHTKGNLLLVQELLRSLTERAQADLPNTWSLAHDTLPRQVREIVAYRLSTLSRDCYRMLTAGAIIGREFTLPVLEVLGGQFTPPHGGSVSKVGGKCVKIAAEK